MNMSPMYVCVCRKEFNIIDHFINEDKLFQKCYISYGDGTIVIIFFRSFSMVAMVALVTKLRAFIL